jgi:hypothetical protein
MTIMIDLLFVFVIASLLTLVFAAGFKKHRRSDTLTVVFMLIFLSAWAGALWIVPVTPVSKYAALGVSIAVGFLVMLLVAALLPTSVKRRKQTPGLRKQPAVAVFNMFVWLCLVMLATSIAIVYMR